MVTGAFILFFDMLGIDMHFIRFLAWTFVDQNEKAQIDMDKDYERVKLDLFWLFVLLVLYIIAFRFYLAPINEIYDARVQALVAPISVVIMFCFFSWDILFMAIHTLLLNAYGAYYVLDPSAAENYT